MKWPWPSPPPDKAQLDRIEAGVKALIQNDKLLMAAINAPAWLTPAASVTVFDVGAPRVSYPPVVDVGGQVYMKLDALQTSVTQLKGAMMSAFDDAKAAIDTLVGLANQAVTTLDSIAAQLDALGAAGGATAEQLAALSAEAAGASGPLSDAIARDTRPLP